MNKYVVNGEISEILRNCIYIKFTNNPRNQVLKLRIDNLLLTNQQRLDLYEYYHESKRGVVVKFRNPQRGLEDLLDAYNFSHLGDNVVEVEVVDEIYFK